MRTCLAGRKKGIKFLGLASSRTEVVRHSFGSQNSAAEKKNAKMGDGFGFSASGVLGKEGKEKVKRRKRKTRTLIRKGERQH